METSVIYEIIGYIASVLIAVSLMMSSVIKLRLINLIGAATFAVYGVLIGSIPVALMNGFIVLINIYFLYNMMGNKEYFKILKVKSSSQYLRYFIDFYSDEMQNVRPDINEKTVGFFVLRDMVPAGLLLGEFDEKGIFTIYLDFVIPNYRDFKIGRYLFEEQKNYFREMGVTKFQTDPGDEDHQQYLNKMGFKAEQNGHKLFLKL